MNIVSIYRISDNSNKEKIKPDYASKENCLRTFVREFGRDNLILPTFYYVKWFYISL